jgi:hypothetical protein
MDYTASTAQKIALFIVIDVRTSNLTLFRLISGFTELKYGSYLKV